MAVAPTKRFVFGEDPLDDDPFGDHHLAMVGVV